MSGSRQVWGGVGAAAIDQDQARAQKFMHVHVVVMPDSVTAAAAGAECGKQWSIFHTLASSPYRLINSFAATQHQLVNILPQHCHHGVLCTA